MPIHVRNVLAVVVGFVAGSAANMALVNVGPSIIPPPEGVDVRDAESLAKSIHLFEPRHFVMPFLAHAVGTFAGAFVACWIAATRKALMAYLVGALFLCAGIAVSFMIPAPTWFLALDLVGAYLPMAWLAIRIGGRGKQGRR